MTVSKTMRMFGGLGGALVVVLGSEFIPPAPVEAVRAPTLNVPVPPVVSTPPAVATASPALVEAILARPLFQASRRPPAGPTAAAAAGPIGLPRLTGVMASNLGKRLIFAPGPDGKPIVVTEGGHIGPYKVQSIGVGEAVVVGPDGAKTLRPAFNAADLSGAGAPVLASGADRAMMDLLRAGGAMPGVGAAAGQQGMNFGGRPPSETSAFAAPGPKLRTLAPRSPSVMSPGLQP